LADLPPWLTVREGGVTVAIKAVPRARRTQAIALQDGRLRVQIAAPPHEGQSNAALQRYLAEAAGVRASATRIHRGSSGARKLVEIDGSSPEIVDHLTAAFGALTEAS
jgi:uncharacterized protein YggU (UPF0235/DUF167 family)